MWKNKFFYHSKNNFFMRYKWHRTKRGCITALLSRADNPLIDKDLVERRHFNLLIFSCYCVHPLFWIGWNSQLLKHCIKWQRGRKFSFTKTQCVLSQIDKVAWIQGRIGFSSALIGYYMFANFKNVGRSKKISIKWRAHSVNSNVFWDSPQMILLDI